MAERKIAPLVPPRLQRGAGRQMLANRNARIDVVDLLAPPRRGSLVYGMGKIDTWGVVSNRATIAALGWTGVDRLHIALVGGSVVVHRDPAGAFEMGSGVADVVDHENVPFDQCAGEPGALVGAEHPAQRAECGH